ncbi:MAG: hypothetical protein ACRD0K_23775 [Egibacteraceae bacterium]
MDETVRVITELQLRREAQKLDRTILVAHLQLRCEHGAEGLESQTVRDWEQRLHVPSAFYQKVLCDYFQVDSVAELGLGDSLEAARYWTRGTELERTREVRRRQLLHLTVQTATASLLPVPALTAAAQLLSGRRRFDPVDVDTAQQVASHLAASYLAAPGRAVISAAQAHAHTLVDLLKRASMTPEVRTQLTALTADAMSLAGHGQTDAGRLAEADAWFTDALRLARDANDPRLEAHALASRAWTLLRCPKPDQAAAIAWFEAAAEFDGVLPHAGRAWLFSNLAIERAAVGDDLGSGRLLERAKTAAALASRDEPGWGWWSAHGALGGWDGVRPEVFTGWRSLRLGRPAEALERFDAALVGTVLPARRANLHEATMLASAALGDPDRACASGVAALDEAKTYGLGTQHEEIRKARKSFPEQWDSLRPVIELDERLALTLVL